MGNGQDKRRELNEALEDAESTFVAGVAGTSVGAAAGAYAAAQTLGAAAAGVVPGAVAGAIAGMGTAAAAQAAGDWAGSDPEAEHEANIMEAAVQIHQQNPDMTGPEAIEQAREQDERR